MGLFKKIMNQTRKPQGFFGGMMLDGMKCHTVNEIESALSVAGFSKIKTDRHESKPWVTVIAKK